MMADEGDGPVKHHKKQEGQRHENKTSDFDEAGEDGGFDSGSKTFHLIPVPRSWFQLATVLEQLTSGP